MEQVCSTSILTWLALLLNPLFVGFLDIHQVHSVALVGFHLQTVALKDQLSGAEMVTLLFRVTWVSEQVCTLFNLMLLLNNLGRMNTYIFQIELLAAVDSIFKL